MARYITTRSLGFALILVLDGACANPVGSEDMGWVRATITDATITDAREERFEGTGWFFEDPAIDEPIRLPLRFTIFSRVRGASIYQTLLIFRPGAGVPSVGAYTLSPLEEKDGMLQGFTVYYGRSSDGLSESFTAVSGELEITLSNRDRVEGTFRYVGSRYCSGPNGPDADYDATYICGDPNTIYPGEPQVEVVGSFAVIPWDLSMPTRLD